MEDVIAVSTILQKVNVAKSINNYKYNCYKMK